MKHIKNDLMSINKIVNGYRATAILSLVLCCFIFCIALGYIYYLKQNGILVVDNQGDIVSASSSNQNDLFKIEADNHIRLFYSRFFCYDKDNVNSQVDLGLILCDKSGFVLYDTYKNKGWYDSVISNDIQVNSYVTDITFENFDNDVVKFACVGFQEVNNGFIKEKRTLDIRGVVKRKNSGRVVVKNPHGLIICDIVITKNNIIIQ